MTLSQSNSELQANQEKVVATKPVESDWNEMKGYGSFAVTCFLGCLGLGLAGAVGHKKFEESAFRSKAATLPQVTPTQVYCEADQWIGKEVIISGAPLFLGEFPFNLENASRYVPNGPGFSATGTMLVPAESPAEVIGYYYGYSARCSEVHDEQSLAVVSNHKLSPNTVKIVGEIKSGEDNKPYLKVSGSFFLEELVDLRQDHWERTK